MNRKPGIYACGNEAKVGDVVRFTCVGGNNLFKEDCLYLVTKLDDDGDPCTKETDTDLNRGVGEDAFRFKLVTREKAKQVPPPPAPPKDPYATHRLDLQARGIETSTAKLPAFKPDNSVSVLLVDTLAEDVP